MLGPNDTSPELTLKLSKASAEYVMQLLSTRPLNEVIFLYNHLANQLTAQPAPQVEMKI